MLPFIKWIQEFLLRLLVPQIFIEHLLGAKATEIPGRKIPWPHGPCSAVTLPPVHPFSHSPREWIQTHLAFTTLSLPIFVSYPSPLVGNFIHHFTKETEDNNAFSPLPPCRVSSLIPFLPASEGWAVILELPPGFERPKCYEHASLLWMYVCNTERTWYFA